jgi:hypothetical protein
VAPFQAVALNDLSSMPPVSVTWQIFLPVAFGAAVVEQALKTSEAINTIARSRENFFDMFPSPHVLEIGFDPGITFPLLGQIQYIPIF